jgi:hypothetical protein
MSILIQSAELMQLSVETCTCPRQPSILDVVGRKTAVDKIAVLTASVSEWAYIVRDIDTNEAKPRLPTPPGELQT